jgi:hypothetical protein
MEIYRRFVDKKNAPAKNIDDMPDQHGSYGALLFDKRWKEKRNVILLRDNNRCVICGLDENLQIHHRQYQYVKALKQFKAPWEYSDRMLITLCNSCHQRGHSKFKVPIIYI